MIVQASATGMDRFSAPVELYGYRSTEAQKDFTFQE